LHPQRRRELRGLARVDVAGVVGAVGEQHHHLAARVAAAQAVERRAEPVADGRARAVDEVEGERAHHALQHGVVERRRHHRVGLAAEHHEPDAVAAAPLDELRHHLLGGLEARGLQVGRAHRARQVDGDHDVDARQLERVGRVDALRAAMATATSTMAATRRAAGRCARRSAQVRGRPREQRPPARP
jgi:hypothetical protein